MPVPESLVLRVNVKTLLAVLLLAVPPLLLDMFLVLDRSRTELTALAGDYFETVAACGSKLRVTACGSVI